MSAHQLLRFVADHAPDRRDEVVENLLGLGHRRQRWEPLGGDLVGYIPSGVGAVVRTLMSVPVTPDDVLLDVGAGMGKVLMLTRLLTGARAHGVELQGKLVTEARAAVADLNLPGLTLAQGDARHMEDVGATVVFMYLPFTGQTLVRTMERIRLMALKRPLVVCALGVDLPGCDWLQPRSSPSFWLQLYDTPGGHTRVPAEDPLWERVAAEKP